MLIVSQCLLNSLSYLDFLAVVCHQDMYEAEQGVQSHLSQPQLLPERTARQGQHHPTLLLHHQAGQTPALSLHKNAVEPSPRPVAQPYYRLHKPRSLFDEVVRMCVHGIAISAMARIKRMAWGTIARWLESAATYAVRFNDRMLRSFVIHELQADEIRNFVGAKKRVIWVLTTLEVWSRLWVSTKVGRRSLQQIKNAILNTLQRGLLKHRFLFTTDGFEMYEWAAKRLLLGVCIYGQVIKKRRENRVVRVDRRLLLGTQGELEAALFHSEDSSTLNTSFVERPQFNHPAGLLLSWPSHTLPRPDVRSSWKVTWRC